MADVPIPISDISDPDQIRVKLLASGKDVHAPLNATVLASATNIPADIRHALVVPVYCTLAQLVLLDTSKDTVAIVSDSSAPDDIFKWVGTDQAARTIAQSLTSTSINSGTDVITKVAHGMFIGSAILATTAVNGLALNTVYWVRKIDADTFTLHPTVEDALGNTNIFNLTGTTNFTMKQLVDPLQDVYVIKTGGQLDGSGGAWIRVKASRSLGIGRARYQRFNDALFVGTGATGMFRDHSGTTANTAAGSWLIDEQGAGSAFNMGYLAGAGVVSAPGYYSGAPNAGVAGLVRTPDGASSSNVWGLTGFASGHATSGGSIAWAAYLEAAKTALSNTTTEGLELEITNLNSTPTTFVNPESTYVQGRTIGMLIGSGGGNAAPYDADVGMLWSANGAKFRSGIVFKTGSLTLDATTNYQHAILLPSKARVEWYTSDALGNVGFSIHSEVSSAANAQFMSVRNGEVRFNNANGGIYGRWLTNTNVAGNYFYIQAANPGSGPIYAVEGGDTNIPLNLAPKGAASVKISTSLARGAPVTKSADFTLADAENWLIVTKGSSCVVTFPAASAYTGREVTIKTTVAFTTVSATSNVVPLAGGSAATAILAATAGKWATLVSDGTNWVIMAGN